MSIPGLQPPPPFLSSPGHPVIPWEQWIQAFKNYMVASGASDLPAMRRKAILLNCLGLEGQRIFQTLTAEDDPRLLASSAAGETLTSPGPDEFDRAIVILEDHYKSSVKVTAARHRFRRRAQAPDCPFVAMSENNDAAERLVVQARSVSGMVLKAVLGRDAEAFLRPVDETFSLLSENRVSDVASRRVNVGCGPAEERYLLTGLHAVADIYCECCKTTLGWKYEHAFESSQKYKEGKYIIELAHMIKENGWD
ncbi:hypothetical protein HPB49_011885 [Dermacentor silvarum]|uniref:Uncharacterized protein n=1 Tax=Dermacentor silvarum TaxID=543639 RepID=A0ACB8D5F5_DERSI|nr:hypothetical protein HPB49_011885 [Dermacentor silvarum]